MSEGKKRERDRDREKKQPESTKIEETLVCPNDARAAVSNKKEIYQNDLLNDDSQFPNFNYSSHISDF